MSTQEKPWHEQDRFWESLGPLFFTEARLEMAVAEITALEEMLQPEPGCDILDLCCGVGRHTVELAKRGYNVVGVDRTRAFLDAARKAALQSGASVEFIEADMREFNRKDAFDLVINMFTAFGYFEEQDENRQVLRNIRSSLRPGGKVVIDVIGKERLAKIFQATNWQELEDGTLVLESRKPADDWAFMHNRWIIVKGTERLEHSFKHRLYSAVELKTLLQEEGYKDVSAFGSFDGSEYDQNSQRLIVVGSV